MREPVFEHQSKTKKPKIQQHNAPNENPKLKFENAAAILHAEARV